LPSSFSTDHSSTLGFSPRLPVSVYGTVGPVIPARGFSWRPASESLGGARRPLRHRLSRLRRSFNPTPRYHLASGHPSPDGSSASASPPTVKHDWTGTGIFTRFPSPTPLGLGLGAGLPGADDPGSGTLRLSVWGILPPIIAYSFRHLHFPPVHAASRQRFHPMGTLPYHENVVSIRGFGGMLSPDHFRRRTTRLVSYYALFKGMAASKPTSQLSVQSHILSHSACTPGP
jgi:hypothetical protein